MTLEALPVAPSIPPSVVQIDVWPGDSWVQTWTMVGRASGVPVDLSAWSFDAWIGGLLDAEALEVDGSELAVGRITVRISPEVSAAVVAGQVFAIVGTLGDDVRTFVRGTVTVGVGGAPVKLAAPQRRVGMHAEWSDVDPLTLVGLARGDKGESGDAVSVVVAQRAEAAEGGAVAARDAAAGHAGQAAADADAAEASRVAAAGSATSAGGSAQTALSAAQGVVAARDAAAQSAEQADVSRASAGASAFAAGGSAAAAQASEDDAKGFRDQAQTSRTSAEAAQSAAEAARDLALAGQFAGAAIAAGTDLNALLLPGTFFQNVAGNATTALNFPAQVRGVLQVTRTQSSRVIQRYTPQNFGAPPRGEWIRTLEGSAWSAWAFNAYQRINNPADQPGVEVITWDDANSRELALLPAGIALGSVNLNSVTLPGKYAQPTTTSATAANNYPRDGVQGLLDVGVAAGRVLQQYYPMGNHVGENGLVRGCWMRRGNVDGSAWTAWAFTPTQRVDETAGRAIYTWDPVNNREQLVYGDTGLRDITALFPASGVVSAITIGAFLRRVGALVELQLYGIAKTVGRNDWSGVLPAGFRPVIAGSGVTSDSVGAVGSMYVDSSGFVSIRGAALGNGTAMLSFQTAQPWPTSLPGSAYGGIPNA